MPKTFTSFFQMDDIKSSVDTFNPPCYRLNRDTSKFVIITNKVTGLDHWTYSEWFYYDTPSKILFEWIELADQNLKSVKYDMFVELNNGKKVKMERSNRFLLKDLCSNHIVEVICKKKG